MPWIVGACVDVVVVAWKEINIMEDEALHLLRQLPTLHKPYVEQLGSVEQFLLALFHHHNSDMNMGQISHQSGNEGIVSARS